MSLSSYVKQIDSLKDLHHLVLSNFWKKNPELIGYIVERYCELVTPSTRGFGSLEFWAAVFDDEQQIGGEAEVVPETEESNPTALFRATTEPENVSPEPEIEPEEIPEPEDVPDVAPEQWSMEESEDFAETQRDDLDRHCKIGETFRQRMKRF